MSTNLLLILVIAAVLILQTTTILIVRHLVRKWCVDVYRAGFAGGRRAGVEASEPFKESYQLGYDVGHERGHSEGYDQAINDAIDNPDAVTKRLLEIRPHAGEAAGRWTDTGSGPGFDEGTAWERHDDPRA